MEEVIKAILNGDKEKYNMILDEYYNEIYSYIYRQVNDIELSKELSQEVFIKVYSNLSRYDYKKASLRTWIYRIATNHTINHYKKRKIDLVNIDKIEISNNEDILESLIDNEKMDIIVSLINSKLTVKYKKIINLHFFSDMSPKEISEALNIPVKSIYTAINLSIKKLKSEVSKIYG